MSCSEPSKLKVLPGIYAWGICMLLQLRQQNRRESIIEIGSLRSYALFRCIPTFGERARRQQNIRSDWGMENVV